MVTPLTANVGGGRGPSGRDGGELKGVSLRDAKGTAGHAACFFDSEESLLLRIGQYKVNDRMKGGTYELSIISDCLGSLGEDILFHLPGDRDRELFGDSAAEK